MQEQINSLFEKSRDYLDTRIELVKLQAIDKAAKAVSATVSSLVIGIIILLMVVILSTGVAIWLGELLGKMYYGFFVVGGFYMLLLALIIACKSSWLTTPISDMIIKKMLN